MALPAVVVSIIAVTSTAASILGIIKRRCGASQVITELTWKCAELVEKVRVLLKAFQYSAKILQYTEGAATALYLWLEEFNTVLKSLEKIDRGTNRTHPMHRTERFIMAQGCAKKMEALYNDLVHIRNGVETIVASWDARKFVGTKVVEEIEEIDGTKVKEYGSRARRHEHHVKKYSAGKWSFELH